MKECKICFRKKDNRMYLVVTELALLSYLQRNVATVPGTFTEYVSSTVFTVQANMVTNSYGIANHDHNSRLKLQNIRQITDPRPGFSRLNLVFFTRFFQKSSTELSTFPTSTNENLWTFCAKAATSFPLGLKTKLPRSIMSNTYNDDQHVKGSRCRAGPPEVKRLQSYGDLTKQ